MEDVNVKVKAWAYVLRGDSGKITFKWTADRELTNCDRRKLIAKLETLIANEIENFELLIPTTQE